MEIVDVDVRHCIVETVEDQRSVLVIASTKQIRLNVSVNVTEPVKLANCLAGLAEITQYFYIIECESHIPIKAR